MIKDLADIVTDPQAMLAIFTAVAIFATFITIALPALERNELASRIKSTTTEREKIRERERARLASENKKTLRENSGGIMQRMVDSLDLKKALADESTFVNLKMAGFRKQSHIYVFLFFRVVLPIIMLFGAAFYVFVLADLEYEFMIKLLIVMGVGMLGFYAPNIFIRNAINKRQLTIKRAWPDAIDLLLICVESGMSIEEAFARVSQEIGVQSPPLAEELILTNAELSYLQERRQAYQNLADRTGLDGVKSVCMALMQAERYGTPLGTALRVLAQENRDMRMSEAEKKAASLPPKLTVPMILFFLPVLFAVIIGPAIIQISEHF